MLVVGFLTIAPFVVWETRYARFPIMRKEMIANRTILGSLGISILLNTWWLQGNYLCMCRPRRGNWPPMRS